MKDPLGRYRYRWPHLPLTDVPGWTLSTERKVFVRDLPEDPGALRDDSRWPAFFPSAMCFCTTRDVERVALEKVTGASVVNRFPYIVALSFCRQNLSRRHHARAHFTTMLERSGCATIQFVPPGPVLNKLLRTIQNVPEEQTSSRIAATGLPVRPAATNGAPVFRQAHLVYEGTLAQPRKDFLGVDVLDKPWVDVGSHRVYFLEVRAIQLRADIDSGRSKIFWRSLPVWQPNSGSHESSPVVRDAGAAGRFQKTYRPNYSFPSAGTVSFEPDTIQDGMAVKYISPSLDAQVEVDNDRARWPCMFPSSLGMITTWQGDGVPNVMPCGSTTVVSRSPLIIAPCITYASINDRYAPRATLEAIRRTGRFGCGVPFIDNRVVDAIQYAGSTSIRDDRNKVEHTGLTVFGEAESPVLSSLPIHYECQVVGEVPLGTHVMFLGEVRRIHVRGDVAPGNPLEWCPWARVVATPPVAFNRTLTRQTITRPGLEELDSLADPSNRRLSRQPEFAEALPR